MLGSPGEFNVFGPEEYRKQDGSESDDQYGQGGKDSFHRGIVAWMQRKSRTGLIGGPRSS